MKTDGKTNVELLAMREAICSRPENQNTGFWRYTAKARKKPDFNALMRLVSARASALA